MNKVCGISATLKARVIGAYTMSLSVLMINVLMSNFFSRKGDEEFFDSCKAWAMLGLHWIQSLRNLQMEKKAEITITCFLVYAIMFLLASAYLAVGSISRKHKYAVPWMYLQIISIIDQCMALSIHLEQQRLQRSSWYILLSSIYLILSIYIWMEVHAAGREWYEQQDHSDCEEARISEPLPASNNGSTKTPSFLSQNFPMFESTRPPILSK